MSPHRTDLIGPGGPWHVPKIRSWMMGRDAFERRMPHHAGIKMLWQTKWKVPCSKGVYPFHDGVYGDFEPIFKKLIADSINDATSAAYTEAFLPTAAALERQGDEALAEGDPDGDEENVVASNLYLRAACVLRIARFPYITAFPEVNDGVKWEAWLAQKRVYAKAGETWKDAPLEEVDIPHVHRAGADRSSIPVYVRRPFGYQHDEDGSSARACPAVLLMTGLDGYRPDNTTRCDEFLTRGWAVVVAEIPGTADCPADPADPASADRLWDSVIGWMAGDGGFDMTRVMAWGLSAGGYHALRAAYTHMAHLRGVVAQGAGCHHFFDPAWIDRAEGHEYPFALGPALARKHGFDSVEEYREKAQSRFSLLEHGILHMPSTKLLLVNGTLDGLMPIEDSLLPCNYGPHNKETRLFENALHMGYPAANSAVYPWMEEVMN